MTAQFISRETISDAIGKLAEEDPEFRDFVIDHFDFLRDVERRKGGDPSEVTLTDGFIEAKCECDSRTEVGTEPESGICTKVYRCAIDMGMYRPVTDEDELEPGELGWELRLDGQDYTNNDDFWLALKYTGPRVLH